MACGHGLSEPYWKIRNKWINKPFRRRKHLTNERWDNELRRLRFFFTFASNRIISCQHVFCVSNVFGCTFSLSSWKNRNLWLRRANGGKKIRHRNNHKQFRNLSKQNSMTFPKPSVDIFKNWTPLNSTSFFLIIAWIRSNIPPGISKHTTRNGKKTRMATMPQGLVAHGHVQPFRSGWVPPVHIVVYRVEHTGLKSWFGSTRP